MTIKSKKRRPRDGFSQFDAVSFYLGNLTEYDAADAHRVFKVFWSKVLRAPAGMAPAGVADEKAAGMFGVSTCTVRRWRAGETRVPPAVFWLVGMAMNKQLPPVFGAFAGFWFDLRYGRWVMVPPGGDASDGVDADQVVKASRWRLTSGLLRMQRDARMTWQHTVPQWVNKPAQIGFDFRLLARAA